MIAFWLGILSATQERREAVRSHAERGNEGGTY